MIITENGAHVLRLVIFASQAAVDHDWQRLRHAKESIEIACWHIEHGSWGWER